MVGLSGKVTLVSNMLKKLVFTIMASASLNDLYDNVSITYHT